MDLKAKLQQLMKNSPTFQSLSPEDQKIRAKAMLSANEEVMKNFIDIFEQEAKEMNKINQDYAGQTDEINNLLSEADQLEKQVNRAIIKEKEGAARSTEEEEADNLLKKLED